MTFWLPDCLQYTSPVVVGGGLPTSDCCAKPSHNVGHNKQQLELGVWSLTLRSRLYIHEQLSISANKESAGARDFDGTARDISGLFYMFVPAEVFCSWLVKAGGRKITLQVPWQNASQRLPTDTAVGLLCEARLEVEGLQILLGMWIMTEVYCVVLQQTEAGGYEPINPDSRFYAWMPPSSTNFFRYLQAHS